MTTVGRPHGNAKYHLENCRCPVCCQAVRDYENNRYRAIAYGRWQPFVDAEPVRQHVRALGEFGIGWMRLARLAGVSTGGVSKLLYGDPQRGLAPTRRVRPETALKLLAVEPVLDNLSDRTVIDGTGTRRRLQALVYAGWTQSELARRMHADRGNFAKTIVSNLVEVATHKTAAALYDQLWRTDPVEAGTPHTVPRPPGRSPSPAAGPRSVPGTTTTSTTRRPTRTGPDGAAHPAAKPSTTGSRFPSASPAATPPPRRPPPSPHTTKAPQKRGPEERRGDVSPVRSPGSASRLPRLGPQSP